ncbi:hypothetical protein LTR84_002606 [Exophiala bonariae]|uniref:NmrA-like domain-containing protein n=1 Tax=Exophiala bonariae TaxID=1690606 RepID=A0AAV9NAY8_9EURO|nr:hypothetical protein LTR84_002606 [Exophiala bonariae]
MASKLIVVIGATGNQGGSVVTTFLNEPGWKVRGISRNASSPASEKLKDKGVEVVQAHLDDTSSLVAAFEGASAVFSVTDFWTLYSNPELQKKVKPGQGQNERTYEHELQHGKNVFDAASQTAGLERLIFSHLSDATKWSKGKYKQIYHFDSKAHAVEYAKAKYPDLWEKTSLLTLGYFLSNFLDSPFLIPRKDETGTYVVATKFETDVKFPHVAAEEDSGPFTKALLACPPGKNLIAYRAWLTMDEFLGIWSKALNVKAKAVHLPYDTVTEGLPEELDREFTEMAQYSAEFGYEGREDPSVVHPKDLETLAKLDTVEAWIKKQDWSKVLS